MKRFFLMWELVIAFRRQQALYCYGSKHFMIYDELDHIIIDQSFLILKRIHQSFFTDTVDHPWDSCRCLMDLIQCLGCKYLLLTSCTVHIDALTDD